MLHAVLLSAILSSPMPKMTYSQTIEFKTPELEAEFVSLHPHARAALFELADWSMARNIPPPYVTSIYRKGERSWHSWRCAFDLRTEHGHYTAEQKAAVLQHLRETWPRAGRASLSLMHDAGSGMHIHFDVEDHAWRKRIK